MLHKRQIINVLLSLAYIFLSPEKIHHDKLLNLTPVCPENSTVCSNEVRKAWCYLSFFQKYIEFLSHTQILKGEFSHCVSERYCLLIRPLHRMCPSKPGSPELNCWSWSFSCTILRIVDLKCHSCCHCSSSRSYTPPYDLVISHLTASWKNLTNCDFCFLSIPPPVLSNQVRLLQLLHNLPFLDH